MKYSSRHKMPHSAVFVAHNCQRSTQIATYISQYPKASFLSVTSSPQKTQQQYAALPPQMQSLFGQNKAIKDDQSVTRMIVSWDRIYDAIDTETGENDLYHVILIEDANTVISQLYKDTSSYAKLAQLALGEYIFDASLVLVSDIELSSKVTKVLQHNDHADIITKDISALPPFLERDDVF